MSKPQTLYEKIWNAHVVETRADGTCLIFIDRHLVHEVTSPQAFESLRVAGRTVRRPDLTLAVPDHNLPTTKRRDAAGVLLPIADPESARQLAALEANAPAFGIGTSEVEHVLATQTLQLARSKTMEVRVEGDIGAGVTAKDIILHITGVIGAAGGNGHVIEYTGSTIRALSIEGRLTISNMAIEGGARAGLIAPDDVTFEYLKGRPMAPKGADWDAAVTYWRSLSTDAGASYDKVVVIDATTIAPSVTWGTSPEDVLPITGIIPDPMSFADPSKQVAAQKSLDYMGLTAGTRMTDVEVQNIFIGSCTNSRIEDLRAAAAVLKGKHKAANVKWAIVVPGSGLVKAQAEAEGLDRIFIDAGLEWREPGCSACLGMNPDKVPAGERCASTSNRNFVGRQGPGSRTHLVSPAMAAAAAVTGRLSDVRELVA